jgi:hypothetical protein
MCPTLTFKWEQDILEGTIMKKIHQVYCFHTRARHHHTPISLENISFPGTKTNEENIQFTFLYITMDAIEAVFEPNIIIQMGT